MHIIDSHTHIVKQLNFDMPVDMLLESMALHNIDFSLTASIEAVEVDHHLEFLKNQVSALELANSYSYSQ